MSACAEFVVSFAVDAAALSALRALNDAVLPVRYSDRFYRGLTQLHYAVLCAWRPRDHALLGAITARIELDVGAASFVREFTASPGDAEDDDDDDLLTLLSDLYQAVISWFVPRRLAHTPAAKPKRLYIMTLAVREDARRLGVASALLDAALAWVAGGERAQHRCQFAALHVKADNDAAIAFYRRAGFEQAHEPLANYYVINGTPSTALYLARDLHRRSVAQESDSAASSSSSALQSQPQPQPSSWFWFWRRAGWDARSDLPSSVQV
jgi:ribosomal protein S18 acetylase RimI-like enzyme